MKYAWIENNRIRDVAHANPSDIYHPDVAVFYNTEVPDDAENGDGWIDNELIKPEPTPIPPLAPRTWSADDVRAGLTLLERVKWDNNSAPEIVTVKQELSTPKELAYTTEVLTLLVNALIITQTSVNKILS